MTTTLEAGRDLDALVAEKVMGHVVDRGIKWREPAIRLSHERTANTPLPRYSTDIAAAWLVVEKLGEMFDDVYVARTKNPYPWEVECSDKHNNTRPRQAVFACADTAPLAICRAAMQSSPSSQRP